MENPLSHSRATNYIGRVLDEDRQSQIDGEMIFSSLEYRIFERLRQEGLLTEKAMEVIGLEGRY